MTKSRDLQRMFVTILKKGAKDNTYKFALARFMLDYVHNLGEDDVNRHIRNATSVEISYDVIASTFLRYYWDQECMYKINQNSPNKKRPKIITIIRKEIGENYIPTKFKDVNREDKLVMLKSVRKNLFGSEAGKTSVVIPRFQNIPGVRLRKTRLFYSYDDNVKKLYLKPDALRLFHQNYVILRDSVLLEWAKYLERFNTMPKLNSKVDSRPKRGSLKHKLRILEKDFSQCFYCEKNLNQRNASVDHFIPWSYIFDDELWNLVLACGRCNSIKRDRLAGKACLDGLLVRNKEYKEEIPQLGRSLEKIDTRLGWEKEIRQHYSNCRSCGFSVQSGVFVCRPHNTQGYLEYIKG